MHNRKPFSMLSSKAYPAQNPVRARGKPVAIPAATKFRSSADARSGLPATVLSKRA